MMAGKTMKAVHYDSYGGGAAALKVLLFHMFMQINCLMSEFLPLLGMLFFFFWKNVVNIF